MHSPALQADGKHGIREAPSILVDEIQACARRTPSTTRCRPADTASRLSHPQSAARARRQPCCRSSGTLYKLELGVSTIQISKFQSFSRAAVCVACRRQRGVRHPGPGAAPRRPGEPAAPCKKNLRQERCLRARLMSAARNKIYAYERRQQNRLATRSRMSRGSFSGSSEPKRSLNTRQASTLASMTPTWRPADAVSSHTPAVVIFV